jgi:hypothetical protein
MSRPAKKAKGLLTERQFTRKQKGHHAQADFSHRRTLVGRRPETRLGAKSKHPGGLKGSKTSMKRPSTYILHASKPVVRRTKYERAKTG